MGLFSLFEKDPSEKWTDYNFTELILDPLNGKLNNVKLGNEVNTLETFGKPDNKNPFKSSYFIYKNAGLIVGTENERITYFSFTLIDNPFEELSATSFILIDGNGEHHIISHETTVPNFEQIIGPSKNQYEMEEGEDREYSVSIFGINVEFDNIGRAVCFDITL